MQTIVVFSSRREGSRLGRWLSLAAGIALSGCSMSIPGFIDRSPTGSIKPVSYPFDKADWSKAEPALIAAIRASAGDDPAQWSNADTGRRGTVIGVGGRFEKSGATCRAFVAKIAETGETSTMQGAACEKAGAVTISDAGPFRTL